MEAVSPFQNSHTRWRAVTQRDPSAHCSFLYGVTSTKIYCRPTCTARIARRANVVFYDTADEAQQAGLRPCQKCKPDDQQFMGQGEEIVVKALALLRSRDDSISMQGGLKQLAKDVGVTPSYLCRVFKKTMGMTIGKYVEAFEAGSSGNDQDGSTLSAPSPATVDGTVQLGTPDTTVASTPGSKNSLQSSINAESNGSDDYNTTVILRPSEIDFTFSPDMTNMISG